MAKETNSQEISLEIPAKSGTWPERLSLECFRLRVPLFAGAGLRSLYPVEPLSSPDYFYAVCSMLR